MSYVNLPENLRDIIYNLSDRVTKLETGPSQPMDYATSAQGTAVSAQSLAYAASVQAIAAQAAATIASTQATVAQTTADGKNKVTYSVSTPGSTANKIGDIWYQYGTSGTYTNKVIAQWSGAGGTSWTSVTVSGLVIANIDAGTITAGVISGIEYSNGSGSFAVSTTGTLQATNAYITGSIKATTGYIGSATNGWIINSTSITGIGSGTIATASSGNAVVIDSTSNGIAFKVAGTTQGWVLPLAANGVLIHYGATANGAGTTYPSLNVSSSGAGVYGASGIGVGVSSTTVTLSGIANLANSTWSYTGTTGSATSGKFAYIAQDGTVSNSAIGFYYSGSSTAPANTQGDNGDYWFGT